MALQQHCEVGGQLLHLLEEVGLVPAAAGAAVVMVARDNQHRQAYPTDGAAGGRDVCLGGLVGVEQISGNGNEGGTLLLRHQTKPPDGA